MKIQHDQWGVVEGVELSSRTGNDSSWRKNGAFYYSDHGWRPVPVEEDVTGECKVDGCVVMVPVDRPEHLCNIAYSPLPTVEADGVVSLWFSHCCDDYCWFGRHWLATDAALLGCD